MSNYFVLQLKRMRSSWLRPVLVCRCIAQQPGGIRCYKHSATCWQMPTESCLCNALCWLWMNHLPAWHSLVPPPIEAKAKLSQNSILPLEISLKCFNGNPFLFEHATKLAQCAYKAYYHISLTFCFLDFRNNFYCFQSVYI